MNDHDTSVIGARLAHLADELAPGFDVRQQVDGARSRHRRARRARIATVSAAAAVVVAAVGVPAAVGHVAGPPGDAARPGPATTTAPSPEEEAARIAADDARAAAAERAAQLDARHRQIADDLAGRTPPLALRAGPTVAAPTPRR